MGITVSPLGLGAIGEPAFHDLLEPILGDAATIAGFGLASIVALLIITTLVKGKDTFELSSIVRPIAHVSESAWVDEVLRLMREQRLHLGLVHNEHGTVVGRDRGRVRRGRRGALPRARRAPSRRRAGARAGARRATRL